jgi:hypothetical protein
MTASVIKTSPHQTNAATQWARWRIRGAALGCRTRTSFFRRLLLGRCTDGELDVHAGVVSCMMDVIGLSRWEWQQHGLQETRWGEDSGGTHIASLLPDHGPEMRLLRLRFSSCHLIMDLITDLCPAGAGSNLLFLRVLHHLCNLLAPIIISRRGHATGVARGQKTMAVLLLHLRDVHWPLAARLLVPERAVPERGLGGQPAVATVRVSRAESVDRCS